MRKCTFWVCLESTYFAETEKKEKNSENTINKGQS